MEIRRLNPGEGHLYREVRLRSLMDSPAAFATTHEAALARDPGSWAAQADASAEGGDRATFIIAGDTVLGLAAIYRDPDIPYEGELLQMWISPHLRGGDAASHLLATALLWAATQGIRLIRAEVKPTNQRALRFYGKHGFQPAPGRESTLLIKTL